MTAVLLFLKAYWKEAVIAMLLISGVWWIRGKDVKIAKLEKEVAAKDQRIAELTLDYDQLKTLNDQRNAEIERLGQEAKNRDKRLQEALAKPPRVIYRDRIVEVPSINTEPCEQVFVDLQHYIERVLQ